MATKQLRREDVNPALLQRAADELEIGVPIHAWEVEGGKLRLHLAYGQTATWPPEEGERGKGKGERGKEEPEGLVLGVDYEWTGEPPADLPIPEDLEGLRKQLLVNLALKHGLKIKRKKNFVKADYVAVLERRRAEL